MKVLHAENYKILWKEVKGDLEKWKDSPCSWIGGLHVASMTVLPKIIYRINAIPIQIPMAFFFQEMILKFMWNCKGY